MGGASVWFLCRFLVRASQESPPGYVAEWLYPKTSYRSSKMVGTGTQGLLLLSTGSIPLAKPPTQAMAKSSKKQQPSKPKTQAYNTQTQRGWDSLKGDEGECSIAVRHTERGWVRTKASSSGTAPEFLPSSSHRIAGWLVRDQHKVLAHSRFLKQAWSQGCRIPWVTPVAANMAPDESVAIAY